MRKAASEPNMGIQWTDSTCLTDLDFADDPSLLAQSSVTLQKVTTNLEIEAKEVNCRVGKAASVFQRMRPIWTSSMISSSTKTGLYNAIVVSIVTYACETWKMTARIAQKLNVFHQRCDVQGPQSKRRDLMQDLLEKTSRRCD